MAAEDTRRDGAGQPKRYAIVQCSCGHRVRISLGARRAKCPKCGNSLKKRQAPVIGTKQVGGPEDATRKLAVVGGVAVGVVAVLIASKITLSVRHERQQDALERAIAEKREKADILLEQRHFVEAKAAYVEARTIGEGLDDDRDSGEEEIDALLASDDIRLGTDPNYVHFEGRWLLKREKEAVLAGRFEAQQRKKGLIKFQDQWMTPEKRDQIRKEEEERERKRQERVAAGLVEHDGRWVTPEEREKLGVFQARQRMAKQNPVQLVLTIFALLAGAAIGLLILVFLGGAMIGGVLSVFGIRFPSRSGHRPVSGQRCPVCNGEGILYAQTDVHTARELDIPLTKPCDRCGGSGCV